MAHNESYMQCALKNEDIMYLTDLPKFISKLPFFAAKLHWRKS